VREIDCWNREGKRKPKLLFENSGVVVRVVAVTGVTLVTGVTRVHVVTSALGSIIMVAALLAATVTKLNLTNQMVFLVTLALVWRAVTLAAWVVITNAHQPSVTFVCLARLLVVVFVLGHIASIVQEL
jgi:hypothetical protein